MRIFWSILWLVVALIWFPHGQSALADSDVRHKSETIDAKGAKKVVADIQYGAGKLYITPAATDPLAQFDVTYTPDRRDYELDYELKGDVGYLNFKPHSQEIHKIDSDHNQLDLTLSTKYSTELKLEVGASSATVDLGGLRLTDLDLEFGAAAGDIDFSKPNPERCRMVKIEAGAAAVDLTHLGNLNFEELKFDGGAGKFKIDLRGTYTGESRAELSIGLGSGDVILPEDVAVRIEADDDNWFSSIDIHSHRLEKISDGVYQSSGYDQAKDRIILKLDVGMGSVDVRWR